MVIMGKGRAYEPETCAGELHATLVRFEGRATAEDLFNQIKRRGHWTDDTIWKEMLSHTINSPSSYHHFPMVSAASKFLFQREDGNYELYDSTWHGQFRNGRRVV